MLDYPEKDYINSQLQKI